MKVVVTGGSGQLGSLVLRRLIDDPSVTSVVSIDVRPPLFVSDKLQAVKLDVRDPRVGRHFAHADALVHLAFVVVKHLSLEEAHSINVGGSRTSSTRRRAPGAPHRLLVLRRRVRRRRRAPQPHHREHAARLAARVRLRATKYEVEDLLDAFERAHRDQRRPPPPVDPARRADGARAGQPPPARLLARHGGRPLPHRLGRRRGRRDGARDEARRARAVQSLVQRPPLLARARAGDRPPRAALHRAGAAGGGAGHRAAGALRRLERGRSRVAPRQGAALHLERARPPGARLGAAVPHRRLRRRALPRPRPASARSRLALFFRLVGLLSRRMALPAGARAVRLVLPARTAGSSASSSPTATSTFDRSHRARRPRW